MMNRLSEYDIECLIDKNEALSRRNRLLTRENSTMIIENLNLRRCRPEMTENNTVVTTDMINLFKQTFVHLSDQMTVINDRMTVMQEENKNLAVIVSEISNELKRKGDHQPVVIQNEQVDDVAVPDTIVCSRCNVEFPIGAFREKAKRKDKNGEFFISQFTRRMCRPCRRKKSTDQEAETTKKTKVT